MGIGREDEEGGGERLTGSENVVEGGKTGRDVRERDGREEDRSAGWRWSRGGFDAAKGGHWEGWTWLGGRRKVELENEGSP